MAPVDLSLLPKERGEAQKRLVLGSGPSLSQMAPQRPKAAEITTLANHVVQACAHQLGITLQRLVEEARIGLDLRSYPRHGGLGMGPPPTPDPPPDHGMH